MFAVRRDAEQVTLLVSQGTVEVQPGGNSRSAKLNAGEQAAFDADRHLSGPKPVDFTSATAWTRGKLIVNKRPLADVVAEFERYYPGRIVVVGDRLKDLKVSGVFELDHPGELLQTLERSLQVSVVRLPLLTLIR